MALIGATYDDARRVMVEGVSGVLAVHDREARPDYRLSRRTSPGRTGRRRRFFRREDPDGLRGPQFDCAWCDEFAKWREPQAAWDMLQFALRVGERPQVLVTTTPRPIPLLKRLLARDGVVISRSATEENRGFLAPDFLAEMRARYDGTRLGRQELEGEMIADDPDALFQREYHRGAPRGGGAGAHARRRGGRPAGRQAINACGIVAPGWARTGASMCSPMRRRNGKGPAQWAAAAVALYHAKAADRVVAEVNQGGSMVEAVLREVDPRVSYRAVHASRGKTRPGRAGGGACTSRGGCRMSGAFPALEDELCQWRGTGEKSPDRLDALVWAVSDLMLQAARAGAADVGGVK